MDSYEERIRAFKLYIKLGGIKVQLNDLVHAVAYLRERSNSMQVGIWREIFGALKHRHGA